MSESVGMEARQAVGPADDVPAPTELRGLTVQTGRKAGTWQPLRSPATLVGRAAGCDIRVSAPTVQSLHCLLIPTNDGIALRALHGGGVPVNGRAAVAAVLRDGDVLEIGPVQFRVRWAAVTPAYDPSTEAVRVQVAALVAQQSAVFDRELRVLERETALARQEEQLGSHLEDQRRQLLDLQEQITDAREDLRRQRSEQEVVAQVQAEELARARNQAADMLGRAKADRLRVANLQRRLKQRWRHERQRLAADRVDIVQQRTQLSADRNHFAEDLARHNGRVELDKRRQKAAWVRFAGERKLWQERRARELADLQLRLHDLARRDKAIAAAEARHAADCELHNKGLDERRHEIEHLEARIGHARQRLLDAQAGLIAAPVAHPMPELPIPESAGLSSPDDSAIQQRLQTLAQVAVELADQRLWLAEQTARLNAARLEWAAERDSTADELQVLTLALQEREQGLIRRSRDVTFAEQRVQSEYDALTQLRQRLEAEYTRRDAALSEWNHELDSRAAECTARDRELKQREMHLTEVLRFWGRRRRQAIDALGQAAVACQSERGEWAAARDVWLREYEHVVGERRELAARTLALEQARQDWLSAMARSSDRAATSTARKRLERLTRQWVSQFDVDVRELERLRETLAAEAVRLDESAEQIRRERLATAEQLAAADERLAELDAGQAQVAAERMRSAAAVEVEHVRRVAAAAQAITLRDEVEGLARLLIDSAPSNRVDRAA